MLKYTNHLLPTCLLVILMVVPPDGWTKQLDPPTQLTLEEPPPQMSARDSILAADSLYHLARDLAFVSKDNRGAIRKCNAGLLLHPLNSDLRILTGRLYAWEGVYDTAEVHLLEVLDKQPDYEDARNALADVYIWSGNFESALIILDSGLAQNASNTDFLYKKALCLLELGIPDAARGILIKLLALDGTHAAAQTMLANLPEPEMLRKFTVAYSYNRLAETRTQWQMLVDEATLDPWQLLTIEGEQQMRFGPLIARISVANRFDQSGTQFELETYPKIRDGTYSYAALGYSKAVLFPIYRLGLEIFQALPGASEISLGFRFLHLENSDINVFTASAGKYLGNYWLNLRTFITPQDVSFSKAWSLQGRRYIRDAESYLEISLGMGESIDAGLGAEEIDYLGSRHIAVQYQHKLNGTNLLRAGVSLENVELRENSFRGDTGLSLNYSYRF